ncbi:hypothetical protein Syun_005715 [Stephania yunnanensis]|uniref:Uncharacterized protein n=1 Tax=Stephania yunnanensis TaxID=152371 RepID=A0AAP0KYN5_9MAGN
MRNDVAISGLVREATLGNALPGGSLACVSKARGFPTLHKVEHGIITDLFFAWPASRQRLYTHRHKKDVVSAGTLVDSCPHHGVRQPNCGTQDDSENNHDYDMMDMTLFSLKQSYKINKMKLTKMAPTFPQIPDPQQVVLALHCSPVAPPRSRSYSVVLHHFSPRLCSSRLSLRALIQSPLRSLFGGIVLSFIPRLAVLDWIKEEHIYLQFMVDSFISKRVWSLPCWDLTETSKRDDGIDLLKDKQALHCRLTEI